MAWNGRSSWLAWLRPAARGGGADRRREMLRKLGATIQATVHVAQKISESAPLDAIAQVAVVRRARSCTSTMRRSGSAPIPPCGSASGPLMGPFLGVPIQNAMTSAIR
jgi:hypothetical protein